MGALLSPTSSNVYQTLLVKRGHIYKGTHSGWYSITDEAFYTQSQVQTNSEGITTAIETGSAVEWTSEENYCFRLSQFRDKLLKYYQDFPTTIVPRKYHTEVVSALERGLEDISISRPRGRLTWGIEVPGDPEQTIYVWFDALVNYLTVTGFPWPRMAAADQMAETGVKDDLTDEATTSSISAENEVSDVNSSMSPESEAEERKSLESTCVETDGTTTASVSAENEICDPNSSMLPGSESEELKSLESASSNTGERTMPPGSAEREASDVNSFISESAAEESKNLESTSSKTDERITTSVSVENEVSDIDSLMSHESQTEELESLESHTKSSTQEIGSYQKTFWPADVHVIGKDIIR